MQTTEIISSIQTRTGHTEHEQRITGAFNTLAREMEDNLPDGLFKRRALEELQAAWLYAKESAGSEDRD